MEQTVSFDVYRFDLATGRLWSGGLELRLTPKASAVLKLLIERVGEPVSKKDLLASIWRDTAVSDDALTSCVQELRKALADDAKQPRFIETRYRRGYRFAAQLSQAAAASVPAPANDATVIAVLPFADMSPGRDQDYLCEGVAEELINALTQVEGLRVLAKATAFQLRNTGADIKQLSRELGVGNLLEGSVQKSGDRIRITVQLVEVESGYHRWSQRFDRTLEDVFRIQDDIAASVVASLRGTVLTQQEKQTLERPHTGATAYEFYLRGRQHLSMRTEAQLHRSAEMFERAIEFDGKYGPALAGLATVHATLYEWFGSKDEDLALAERSSQRALEIAPDLADAHVARGVTLTLSQRYQEAAQEFEEAIRLAPTLFEACYFYARSSFAAGDAEKAAEMFEKAADARQEDYQAPMLRSLPLRKLGRVAEAQATAREGIRRVERHLMLNPRDVRALSIGACSLLTDGQTNRALEWSQKALEYSPDEMSALMNGACVHARLGHKEMALDLLQRALGRGRGKRDWIEHDPDFDCLRDDPRFNKLMEALK